MACARNEGEKRLVRKVSGLLDLCYGCSSCNIQFRRLFFCGFAPYKSNWRKNNLWSPLGIKVLDGCVKQRKNGVFEVCETNFVRTRLKSTRPPFSVFFREWISKTSCFITLKNRTTCKFLFWHQGCLFYQEAVREFAYGQQYAWMLVIFTLMVVFCLTCPLVTPFGKSRKTFSSRL